MNHAAVMTVIVNNSSRIIYLIIPSSLLEELELRPVRLRVILIMRQLISRV